MTSPINARSKLVSSSSTSSDSAFDASQELKNIFPEWPKGWLGSQLDSLAKTENKTLFYDDILAMAYDLEDKNQLTSAASIYQYLIEHVPNSNSSVQAQKRLQGMTGTGSIADRLEFQSKRFLDQTCDYKVIVPMFAATTVYHLGRRTVWKGLTRSSAAAWWNRSRGAEIISKGAGFLAETTTFTLGSRVLQTGLNSTVFWDLPTIKSDWLKAGLTLGVLKGAGFLGRWGSQSYRNSMAGKYFLWSDQRNLALLQGGLSYLGLVGAHHLEAALDWSEASASPWLDGLSAYLSLTLGARLGQEILGKQFIAWQTRMSLPELPVSSRWSNGSYFLTPTLAMGTASPENIFARPLFMAVGDRPKGPGRKHTPPKKPRMGRPRIYSDQEIADALSQNNGSVEVAAKRIGACYQTVLHRIRVAEPKSPLRPYRENESNLVTLKERQTHSDEVLAEALEHAYGHFVTAAGRVSISLEYLYYRIKNAKTDSPLATFRGPKPKNGVKTLSKLSHEVAQILNEAKAVFHDWNITGLIPSRIQLQTLVSQHDRIDQAIKDLGHLDKHQRTLERYRIGHELGELKEQSKGFLDGLEIERLLETQRLEFHRTGLLARNALRVPIELNWYLRMLEATEMAGDLETLSVHSGLTVELLRGFALGGLPTRRKDLLALAPSLPQPKRASEFWQDCWHRISVETDAGTRELPQRLQEILVNWRRYSGPPQGKAGFLDGLLASYFHPRSAARKKKFSHFIERRWQKYYNPAEVQEAIHQEAISFEKLLDDLDRVILNEMILTNTRTSADFARDFRLKPDQAQKMQNTLRHKLAKNVDRHLRFNAPVEILELKPGIIEVLSEHDVNTVAELTQITVEDLSKMSGMTSEDIRRIQKVLHYHHWTLKTHQIQFPELNHRFTLLERPLIEHHPPTTELLSLGLAGVRTFYDLIRMSEGDLERIRGIGRVKISNIKSQLNNLGLELGMPLKPFDTPIAELKLPPEIVNVLQGQQVHIVADLVYRQGEFPPSILSRADEINRRLAEWYGNQPSTPSSK